MRNYKKLEDMDVLDNFMFNAIATDPDVAEPFFREVLSVLLEREIGKVSVHAQVFVPADNPERRGICLDVEITEEDDSTANCRIYNVEGQKYREENIQKRCRFYQAKKDSRKLKRGEKNWGKLPDLYMIVIMNYDPFGKGNMIYTFENVCREHPDIDYRDGLKFIYFNTTGTKGGSELIKQLLKYLNCSKIESVTNEKIAQIHNYVSDVKYSAEVEQRYMTLGEWFDRMRDEAVAEAVEEALAEATEKAAEETEKATKAATKNGQNKVLLDILSELGEVPDEVLEVLKDVEDSERRRWIKLAVRSETMDDFLKNWKA